MTSVQSFVLTNRKDKEIIKKVNATSLSEAVKMFAIIKHLRPDQLLEIYSVYEENTNGKRSIKKGS